MADQGKKRRNSHTKSQTLTATLSDGRTIEFLPDRIGEGGMKDVYFTHDRRDVICFFKDQATGSDPGRLARLERILGTYNPTLDPHSSAYWSQLFCWPTGIVVKPQLGILAPAYPSNYYFGSGPFLGKEKEGRWFTSSKLRSLLPPAERGNWYTYFSLCTRMARAVRRLHQAGLAHSDLSPKNVLIDPSTGTSVLIDIDSLVVPGLFPPDVLGTPGYIAPEVLATSTLPLDDPKRISPSARTDQHALAVLIYEYLLFRHPLRGKKVNSVTSAEEDEHLSMGSKALFVEHPTDSSNPTVSPVQIPVSALGKKLHNLFIRAFVNGLHSPDERPAAIEWERALVETMQLLYPCPNASCSHGWMLITDEASIRCQACGAKPREPIPMLNLRKEGRPGQWLQDGKMVLSRDARLFRWHVFDNIFPGEVADRTPQAYCAYHEGKWILVNEALDSLTSPGGKRVAVGQAVALTDGAQFRLSQAEHGRIAEVQLLQP